MTSRLRERVNKTECCRRFGWTRHEFDKNAASGMPVLEAATHKGAEWRVDPGAVARWIEEREAEEVATRQRVRDYYARQEAERRAAEKARWQREQAQERARREAERRREAEWQEFVRAERLHRHLERAYGHCKRLAYLDLGAPKGLDWPERHPEFRRDWPPDRPLWWMPPPGMLEAIQAEPTVIPFGHQEPDWRRWWPGYVPGRPWPWRDDGYREPRRPSR